MRTKGSFNRRTGKTTPRHKAKTHWAAKGSKRRTSPAAKPAKAAVTSASKSK